jgi:uncharacterized iron-regulated membrane protein
MSKQQLRQLWFQMHKWLGLSLALLIIPISLTGSALVWHDALDLALNPERRTEARPSLPPSAYASAALNAARTGERLISLGFAPEGGAVRATVAKPHQGQGRPVRTTLYLDPATGKLLDRSASNEGLVHVLHVLHGSLMIPGIGRQIVGWIGVAMLLSCLTGLWLWWPLNGRFTRGFRWRRKPETSANLHYQGGFWIALPLAVLSLTGAWISFPAVFAALAGDPAPPSAADRMRRMSAQPLAETRLNADAVIALAARGEKAPVTQLIWPTSAEASWKASFGRSEVSVDDETATVTPPQPQQPETNARLMRRIHDGTGMSTLWQAIIFIAGIIPAILAITGIMMWLKLRRKHGVGRSAWDSDHSGRGQPDSFRKAA